MTSSVPSVDLAETAQGEHGLLTSGRSKRSAPRNWLRDVGSGQCRLNRRRLGVRAEAPQSRRGPPSLSMGAVILSVPAASCSSSHVNHSTSAGGSAEASVQLGELPRSAGSEVGVRAARSGQQAVRRLHHLRMGAVVAGQLHRVRATVPSREIQQVTASRTGEE